jgi:hypothetical protein
MDHHELENLNTHGVDSLPTDEKQIWQISFGSSDILIKCVASFHKKD